MRSFAHLSSSLLMLLVCGPQLLADSLELPLEWPLGIDSQLVFELDNADLHLKTRSEGLPLLQAQAVTAGESAHLDIVSSGGQLNVRRAGGEAGPRVRIEVALGPGRSVQIAGADLMVRAHNDLPKDAGGLGVQLEIERSKAELTGVQTSRLEATASSLDLLGTEGTLTLTLREGSAQVQEHQGHLLLESHGTDVVVADHQGLFEPRLQGGSLQIIGGEGRLAGTLEGAEISFDDWRGAIDVQGRDGRLEGRSESFRSPWKIEGQDLDVLLEGLKGPVKITLEGGSFEATGLAALRATLRGSQAELRESSATVNLILEEAAEALVAGIAGVDAEVTDSRLEIERIDRLKLTGSDADITAHQLQHLESLELSDSQLTLDLRDSRRDSSLELSGSSYATVSLREPCLILLRDAETAFGSQVGVSGCEVRDSSEQVPPRQDRVQYGEDLIKLKAGVGPNAILEVTGEP